jgi:hypothetical protein
MLERGSRLALIVDGREIGQFDGFAIKSFSFGPDGKHFAFVGRKGEGDVLYVDGVEKARSERILAQHPVYFSSADRVRLMVIEMRMIQAMRVSFSAP